MPNDTRDDLRSLLTRAAGELPNRAPQPERTLRRARRRMAGTIGALALVLCVVVGGVLAVAQPFDRSQPANTQKPQPKGVWLVNVDTGAQSQLTGIPKSAFWFTASRDGSTIAFTANHGKDPAAREQVYVMAADGSDLRKVTDERYGASEPTLSYDGSFVAYKALDDSNTRNVFVVPTDGSGRAVQLTRERHDVASLSWSTAGDSILYSVSIPSQLNSGAPSSYGSSKIKKVDVASHEVETLVGTKRASADFGTWSSSGSEIAYLTGNEWADEAYGFDPAEIWIMGSDGSHPHLVASFDQRAFELAWSPTRNVVAFTIQETGGSFGIYLLDIATRETRRVTDGVFPVWLDGHTLIVVR
jgi:Tol biopolymer transport system component